MDSFSSSKLTDLISKLNDESAMVQYKSIGKLYLQLKQMSSNETEKRKAFNLIMDSIGTLKSRTCRVTLLNMLTQCCQEGIVDLNWFVNSLLSLINSNYEKYVSARFCFHCSSLSFSFKFNLARIKLVLFGYFDQVNDSIP